MGTSNNKKQLLFLQMFQSTMQPPGLLRLVVGNWTQTYHVYRHLPNITQTHLLFKSQYTTLNIQQHGQSDTNIPRLPQCTKYDANIPVLKITVVCVEYPRTWAFRHKSLPRCTKYDANIPVLKITVVCVEYPRTWAFRHKRLLRCTDYDSNKPVLKSR